MDHCENFNAFDEVGYFKDNVRSDGRNFTESRQTLLNVGIISTANGSALVKLGNTSVICGIKSELTLPTVENPDLGLVVPNLELSPICCSLFKSGPPNDKAQSVTVFLDNLIKKLIKFEDLCIMRDKLAWVLYCDFVCLNYDGNIEDACVLALTAALQNTLLPEVTVDAETEQPVTNYKEKLPLNLKFLPISTTFSFFDNSVTIIDPTLSEEHACNGNLTIITDKNEMLILVKREGGVPLKDEQIHSCIKQAVSSGTTMRQLYNAVK